MHILTGNLIRDLPTNRVNGLSAQVWRSCSETGPIIHLGSKVGRGETLKKAQYYCMMASHCLISKSNTVDCKKSSMKETKGQSVSVSVPGCCLS